MTKYFAWYFPVFPSISCFYDNQQGGIYREILVFTTRYFPPLYLPANPAQSMIKTLQIWIIVWNNQSSFDPKWSNSWTVMMYLHNNFEIKKWKKKSPSIMIYMIIYLTPHDPKTPCYHKYCILNRQHTTARFEVHRLHFSYPVSNGIHLILRYFVQGLSVSCIQQVK